MQLKSQIIVAALAAALLVISPAGSAPPVPVNASPASGTPFDGVPALAWNGVGGAYRYEFQLSADPGFNSTQASFFTRNTRATVTETLTNGTYWWRVRSDDGLGNVSAWSTPTSFVMNWGAAPTLSAPANGATVVYPATPLTLKWNSTSRAAKYRLELATDPALGSSVAAGYPLETHALEFTVPEALANGTYYWAVTPIDARGNLGSRSAVRSFVWSWPWTPQTPAVTDLVADPEFYDPQFSWNTVPGAARYEVEISSADAPGSVVYSGTTIATAFSPKEVFDDNVYNWRVRGLDPAGHPGNWTDGPQFTRAFDKTPPAINNLHMHGYLSDAPAVDNDPAVAGFQTQVPLVKWNSVPGASSYQIQVAPFAGSCNFNNPVFDDVTATNAWTPLGKNPTNAPFPAPLLVGVSSEFNELTAGNSYCVRVRAKSAHVASIAVWGAFTLLNDGTGAAFTWTGYPSTSACSPSCNAGYLGSADYLLPARATTVTRMPFLTWEPLDGALSYWVIVSKDANFATIIDYAFTRFPAYAPRRGSSVRTYADEQTAYYWAVLPSPTSNGDFAAFDPSQAAASTFEKHSVPPPLVLPTEGATVAAQPTFQWTTAEGARRYRIQVATDVNFGAPNILDDVTTASTAYSTDETYPADTVLYWRVQAQDEEVRGLTWSIPRTFGKTLPAPTLDPANVTSGDLIPTFAWTPVTGAVSYDVHLQVPDGSWARDATNIAASAVTAVQLTGTGVFQWQVRANFPKDFGVTRGPYTPLQSFTRTIREPQTPATDAGQNRLLLSWAPKTGAKTYRVQVSNRPDFAPAMESVTTDTTNFASKLTSFAYGAGGTFYWRVAAMDPDRNVGDFTATQTFTMPPLTQAATSTPPTTTPPTSTLKVFGLTSKGRLVKKRYRTVTIVVKNAANGAAVYRASVRVSGVGLTAKTKSTNSSGVVKFYLRPTKLGRATFRVTKSGFAAKNLFKRVWAR